MGGSRPPPPNIIGQGGIGASVGGGWPGDNCEPLCFARLTGGGDADGLRIACCLSPALTTGGSGSDGRSPVGDTRLVDMANGCDDVIGGGGMWNGGVDT